MGRQNLLRYLRSEIKDYGFSKEIPWLVFSTLRFRQVGLT